MLPPQQEMRQRETLHGDGLRKEMLLHREGVRLAAKD